LGEKTTRIDKAKATKNHTTISLHSLLISLTVQLLLIQLAYNLTASYRNEHSRASAGRALTDYLTGNEHQVSFKNARVDIQEQAAFILLHAALIFFIRSVARQTSFSDAPLLRNASG
jgi:hypothetical protein